MLKNSFLFVSLFLLSSNALADCAFDIESNDAMQFNIQNMEVKSSCENVTVNLKHTGSIPAAAMGHNWVLTKTSDYQPVATDGMAVGLEGDYVPANDDRVIAATKVIGGGESTSTVFSIDGLSKDEEYTFFCSFPGHWVVMKGTFKIID